MSRTQRRDAPETTARSVSLDLLREVIDRKRPLDDSLAAHRGLADLQARDRAFARLLVATVLRRLGQIDLLIDQALDSPLKPGLGAVRNILRLGLAQLLFLGTAPHAAVAATVALAVGRRLAGYRGLINAVLRRLSQEGPVLVTGQDAARLNTPDWLWTSWVAAYGDATAAKIAEQHLSDPPLDLSLKPGENLDHWATQLEAERLGPQALRLPAGHGRIDALPGYRDGAWWVQDLAASLPGRLLGEVADRRVVDLCAAPGGKTAWLATEGARVTAVDRSGPRMARLSANLERLGLEAETVVADGSRWRPDAPADLVLLDAPCSGTGTLRRHPDIARLKGPGDVASLAAAQDRLLRAAIEICAPGGLIVYAVCSLQPEEGPHRIAALLRDGQPARRRPVTPALLDLGPAAPINPDAFITPEGDLRTLPSHLASLGGMDGFYACCLQRI